MLGMLMLRLVMMMVLMLLLGMLRLLLMMLLMLLLGMLLLLMHMYTLIHILFHPRTCKIRKREGLDPKSALSYHAIGA